MFGNPAQIDRAVRSAVPDCDGLLKRRAKLEVDLSSLVKSRDRILALIVKGTITDEQAEKQLEQLKDHESSLREELRRLGEQLDNLPDEESLRVYIERVNDSIFLYDKEGNTYAGGNDVQSFVMMTQADKRHLVDVVFNKPLPDGKPAGVYVAPEDGPRFGPKRRTRPWKFTIKGQLEFEAVVSTNRNNVSEPFSPCPPSGSTNI